MARQIGFLRSKVAVRVFMLFILSALVPVTALTLVFYQAFSERSGTPPFKDSRSSLRTAGALESSAPPEPCPHP
ncbi:MAG: hypothetical protein P8Y25_10985 [Chromatiaceae bacterium]